LLDQSQAVTQHLAGVLVTAGADEALNQLFPGARSAQRFWLALPSSLSSARWHNTPFAAHGLKTVANTPVGDAERGLARTSKTRIKSSYACNRESRRTCRKPT
jgi:hypothetical protein